VRRNAIIVLIGLVLIGSSCTIPFTQTQYSRRPLDIAFPSQSSESIVIDGNTQLAQQSTGGAGTQSDPYLIEGLNIRVSSGSCITIQDTTSFFVISNCVLSSDSQQDDIIGFYAVENGAIENCYVKGGNIGVRFSFCANCSIRKSICIENNQGIAVSDSDNCTVVECISHSNAIGVSIGARDSAVINSSIYRNDNGVNVHSYSERSRIYYNKIGWNSVNAYNDSNSTDFTDGVGTGNAWSDYTGNGTYTIAGYALSTDSFPSILVDNDNPTIDSPSDKAFDVDSVGETLTWTASDDLPYTYTLYIDGIAQGVVPWDGLPIVIPLDALPEGTYRMLMQVSDAAGNTARDEVTVTAVSFLLGGIGTELVMWASALTVVIFIGVVVLITKAT
jgi:parallel beta-helix repeat protein